MQRLRVQALLPPAVVAGWLALLGVTALLAAYGTALGETSWEAETTRRIQAASPGTLNAVAEFMTLIGRSPVSTAIPAIAILALWFCGRRRLSVFLAVAALARAMSPIAKGLVDRPRPSTSLVDVANQLGDPSFPSGHVLGATLFFGFLIYCAEDVIPGKTLRRTVQASLAFLIVLMGYARIQLGEHWPTDVLGGYAIGFLVLIPLIWLHSRWVGADRIERPGEAEAAAKHRDQMRPA